MDNNKDGFEKLMETSPKEALRHVEKFQEMIFWRYFFAYLLQTATDLLGDLYSCEIKDVKRIRGEIKAHSVIRDFPDQIEDQLKDEIALLKEAANVEEARTPEEEKGK